MTDERIYRRLLTLYPAPFRREYGHMMIESFRQLREEYGRRGCEFWGMIVVDVVRSALSEHVGAVVNTMDAQWPTVVAIGGLIGSVLFLGLFRVLTAVLGPLPGEIRLLVDGGLIGYGLGWAQCATIGYHFNRRQPWLLASLAAGVVGFRVGTAVSTLISPDQAAIPITLESAAISGAAGCLLIGTLMYLSVRGGRDVAGSWLRMNVLALPATIGSVTVMLIAVHLLKAEGDLSDVARILFHVSNPLLVTVAIGAITARPLWRLAVTGRSIEHPLG